MDRSEEIIAIQEIRVADIDPHEILAAGSDLLNHFGIEADPLTHAVEFLAALDQIDPRYVGDRVLIRNALEQDTTVWPEDTKQFIVQAAEKMHILETESPLVGVFDVVVVFGGTRQAPLDRVRYAAQAIRSGVAKTRHLIVSGSSRELSPTDQENASNYAPGAKTEFDLMSAAAKTVALENPGLMIEVSYVDNKKASAEDSLAAVFSELQARNELQANSRVGGVTTQIYRSFFSLDTRRVAKQFMVSEETFVAGNPSDPKIVAARTPATYLSEVCRTLKAATKAAQGDTIYEQNIAEADLRAEEEWRAQISAKEEAEVLALVASNPRRYQRNGDRRVVEDLFEQVEYSWDNGRRWCMGSTSGGQRYMGPDDLMGFPSSP